MTLSLAIGISMVISLTTTPMLCALFLKPETKRPHVVRRSLFDRVRDAYGRSLVVALDHGSSW